MPKAVELTVENPFQFALYAGQKESELDILYRDENNRQVQLEMQVQYHKGLNQRMLHNWTQLYQRQLGETRQAWCCTKTCASSPSSCRPGNIG